MLDPFLKDCQESSCSIVSFVITLIKKEDTPI